MSGSPTPPDAVALFDELKAGSTDYAPAATGSSSPSEASDELVLLSKIMIVDDEAYNIQVFHKHLQLAGYRYFVTTSESTQAMAMLRREQPDLLLLDIMMPQVSGLDILEQLRSLPEYRHLPVIILTASTDRETKQRALQLGTNDYLNKPIDYEDLTLRVRNALLMKIFQDRLTRQAELLEEVVEKRTTELAASREEIIRCLARAGELRDNETGNHVIRVGKYVGIIADELGFDAERVSLLEQAAQLHDVGKIAIPDSILLSPGKLSEEQFRFMKKHCLFGRDVIQPLAPRDTERLAKHVELGAHLLSVRSTPMLETAALIALTHHEKWDGSGYPIGLAGSDIPIEGRMTAVADVFDALSSKRPYKNAMPREKCFAILESEKGKHFDPEVLDAFFRRQQDIIRVQIDYACIAD
jgi:putative two-component system response regulator